MKDSDNGGPIQPDGDDILFLKTDGTKLSHEIEEYDGSTGQLTAWVMIPSLSSSTDTELYLYYGNPSCSSQQDATNVWDSNYTGIWHLNEATDATNKDATSNANDGTPVGSPVGTTGQIAGALDFNVSGDATRIEIPADTSLDLSLDSNWTLSGWAKPTSYGTGEIKWPAVYEYGQTTLGLTVKEAKDPDPPLEGTIEHWRNDEKDIHSDTPLDFNAWNHIVIVRDPDTTRFFLNGSADGTRASVPITEVGEPSWIGSDTTYPIEDDFLGLIDEVSVSSTARDSSWIATEYRNQNSPGTFMSFSNQTAAGVSKSLAYGISTNNSKAYGTINNQSVSGSITAGEWNHISLTYDKDAGGTDEIKLYLNGTQSATGDYATAISTNNNNLLLGDMVGFIGKMD